MTLLAAFLAGVAVTTLAAVRLHLRWADEHHWRRVRLEALRVDALYRDKDHLERLNRRITDEHSELREGVGDLLDTVAEKDRVIHSLTRRSPLPLYGRHAHVRVVAAHGRTTA